MNIEITTTPIILTTGIYDLLKEQIKKHTFNKSNAEKLAIELKKAKQVLNRELPENIVAINTLVRLKNLKTGEEIERKFVSPQKARKKNSTTSILSPVGIATLGYATGAIIQWEFPEGTETLQILEVSRM